MDTAQIVDTRENNARDSKFGALFNKVPEVTLFFWIIKVLCTTVGETASDFLNVNLNLGLSGTSLVKIECIESVFSFQYQTAKVMCLLFIGLMLF